MKKYFSLKQLEICGLNQTAALRRVVFRLIAGLVFSLVMSGGVPHLASKAQESSGQNKVWNVSAQPAGSGTMVTIAADSAVGRTQNWQDSEGYHVVLPDTAAANSLKAVRGVKVRRVGTSLEVLFQTKPGSKVNVQTEGNEITLVVDKKLEAPPSDREYKNERASTEEKQLFEDAASARQARSDNGPVKFSSPIEDLSSRSKPPSGEIAQNSGNWNPAIGPASPLPQQGLPQRDASASPAAAEEVTVQAEDEGALASIFSATSVFVVIALGLFGLLVSRKLRSRQALAHAAETESSDDADWVASQTVEGKLRPQNESPAQSEALVRSNGAAIATASSRQSSVRMAVAGPTSLYGAYRIDQEVGKLILGQPHRMDVLASRAIDDRRAIETSLIKGVNSTDLDEDGRRRACAALEEYGFVARQCATLLLAADPFERSSAARSLGEIKSEAALPFLLEGLYDSEAIVRNQAVTSIGELKMPSAIGALLDIARTHPDVPSGLLSRTLSACSVEGLDFFDAMPIDPAQLGSGNELSVIERITHLEPATSVEELPEGSDDEQLTLALTSLGSVEVQERAEALKVLGQFRVRSSVSALIRLALHDSESNLRAIAVASLSSIDHESVFPAILIGMADESREVRAAAARALSRLSFDRSEAYAHVIETSDEETLGNVARACIKAGIVAQNLDRLASSDYRQSYETFALICLLAKADMNEPILNAIADHPNPDVRLRAVHLLSSTGQPGILEHLRQLAVRDGVREEVKTALLEAMYRLDQQAQQKEKETVAAVEVVAEPQLETPSPDTVESEVEVGFAFTFEPSTESDQEQKLDMEVETNLADLEM